MIEIRRFEFLTGIRSRLIQGYLTESISSGSNYGSKFLVEVHSKNRASNFEPR